MSRKKFLIRIVILFSISTLLLAGICTLGILGTKEKKYYQKNYKSTLMQVSNFTVNREPCSLSLFKKSYSLTYKGYINVVYNVKGVLYESSFTRPEFCKTTYNSTINILKQRFHESKQFYIWYFIKNPSIWIFQRPAGEAYIVLSVFFIFFFLFSIFIGCVYLVRDKHYLVSQQEHVKFQEIINF
jgi:hypothetical protein